jgi:uncharacterized SAM-binding protein YcdF (DUF218 family)
MKLKWIRVIGFVVGIICLCGFWAPLAVAGILNLGNVTGIILSIVLILYMIFIPTVHKLMGKLWSMRFSKIPMAIAGGLVIICATLVVVESACMAGACMKQGTEASTAVVLGCRVYGERASLSLVERLEAAYDYLTEHPYADCVVSGGQGPGEDISEAECMYRWLVDKGIDPARIYKEDKSTSTEENIAFSKEVIEKNGLFQKIVIVTNEYHIYRAGMLADDNEIVWGAQPAQSAMWLFPTYYIRELYAILAEWILY